MASRGPLNADVRGRNDVLVRSVENRVADSSGSARVRDLNGWLHGHRRIRELHRLFWRTRLGLDWLLWNNYLWPSGRRTLWGSALRLSYAPFSIVMASSPPDRRFAFCSYCNPRSRDGPSVPDRRNACGWNYSCADDSATSNYALERSVRGWSERAAGAQTIIAPAARLMRRARTAQRGR